MHAFCVYWTGSTCLSAKLPRGQLGVKQAYCGDALTPYFRELSRLYHILSIIEDFFNFVYDSTVLCLVFK